MPEYIDPPGFEDPPMYLEFDIATANTVERWEVRFTAGRSLVCTKRDVPAPALVLVGCGQAKRKVPSRACELYNSSLFAAHWKLAQCYNAPIKILSAEHRVLDPQREIHYYERSLKTMRAAERAAWDREIATWVLNNIPAGSSIIVLAGAEYVRWRSLVPEYEVLEPLARLTLGDRLQLAFPKDPA